MRYRNHRKPTVRTITVKYDGACACCGATIKAGEMADYYPVGTIASRTTAAIAHVGGLNGNSARCADNIRRDRDKPQGPFLGVVGLKRPSENDREYAPDVDRAYEDQCADICGR